MKQWRSRRACISLRAQVDKGKSPFLKAFTGRHGGKEVYSVTELTEDFVYWEV